MNVIDMIKDKALPHVVGNVFHKLVNKYGQLEVKSGDIKFRKQRRPNAEGKRYTLDSYSVRLREEIKNVYGVDGGFYIMCSCVEDSYVIDVMFDTPIGDALLVERVIEIQVAGASQLAGFVKSHFDGKLAVVANRVKKAA